MKADIIDLVNRMRKWKCIVEEILEDLCEIATLRHTSYTNLPFVTVYNFIQNDDVQYNTQEKVESTRGVSINAYNDSNSIGQM